MNQFSEWLVNSWIGVKLVELNAPLLSVLIFSPLVGVFFILFVDREKKALIRNIAFLTSLGNLAICLVMMAFFKPQTSLMQFVENREWIREFGINYHLGLDGISILLVFLTSLLTPICILSSWNSIQNKVKEYHIFFLMLETGMLGVFLSLDLVLFYMFWEAMLIPMYFIIGVWGGPRRIYAAIKFFLFTMVGSVLMLVAIIALYFIHKDATVSAAFPDGIATFDLMAINSVVIVPNLQLWLFAAFALAFAIKVPMFPFHTWLPDAHVEAPTAGSVILAGVLLKMGTYGFLRFAMPLFPYATHYFMPLICTLAVIGIIYGALVAMVQPDIKKLVAYSSVSHLGFVMLGLFALNYQGIEGGILQMINHGFSTGALFLIVGMIYERRHTRMISDFGGIARVMPVFFVFFLVVTLSSIGLPGLNGFVGEFLILVGAFTNQYLNHGIYYAIFAATGVIFAAIYMLWMFQRVMYGPITKPENQKLKDLSFREIALLVPIIIFIFWIGVYSKPFINLMHASVRDFEAQLAAKYKASQTITFPEGKKGVLWYVPKEPDQEAQNTVMPSLSDINFLLPVAVDFKLISPQIYILVFMLTILIFDMVLGYEDTRSSAIFAVAGLAVAGFYSVRVLWGFNMNAFNGMLLVDNYSLFFNLIFVAAGLLTVLSSVRYIEREDMNYSEYYVVILGAVLGMMIMAAAGSLITVFVGIELLSISLYILAGFNRNRPESGEAALKYLLLGAFSTGFLLYGIALVYGATGSLDLISIGDYIRVHGVYSNTGGGILMAFGVMMIIVGFSFKASLVPFHMWAPDVYQGAPTPITGLMSTAAKAAAFAVFFRVISVSFPALHYQWHHILYIVAILTMTVGNITAINQENVKRMLAYSSIAHAGYILIAVLAAGKGEVLGAKSIGFYLLAYTFMNMGAFGIIAALERKGRRNDMLDSFAGLAYRNPAYAAAMTICLLSLAGIPPTAGFIGKFYIFAAGYRAGLLPLVIVGVINAVISVYYYLRIVVKMYISEPEGEYEKDPVCWWPAALAALISVVAVLAIGMFPSRFIELASSAILGNI